MHVANDIKICYSHIIKYTARGESRVANIV